MDSRHQFLILMEQLAPLSGLTPIAARILGVLIFDGREMSFSELAQDLQVSRGSISTNTRMLADWHVIERIRKPGERQDHFRVAAEVFPQLLAEWARSATEVANAMRGISTSMPDTEAAPRERIESFADLYEGMADAMAASATSMMGQDQEE